MKNLRENIENRNRQKFNRVYLNLKNIVRTTCYSKENDQIEKLTVDIIDEILRHKSQNIISLEGNNFEIKLPQIREFKYRREVQEQEENEPTFFDKFKHF